MFQERTLAPDLSLELTAIHKKRRNVTNSDLVRPNRCWVGGVGQQLLAITVRRQSRRQSEHEQSESKHCYSMEKSYGTR